MNNARNDHEVQAAERLVAEFCKAHPRPFIQELGEVLASTALLLGTVVAPILLFFGAFVLGMNEWGAATSLVMKLVAGKPSYGHWGLMRFTASMLLVIPAVFVLRLVIEWKTSKAKSFGDFAVDRLVSWSFRVIETRPDGFLAGTLVRVVYSLPTETKPR